MYALRSWTVIFALIAVVLIPAAFLAPTVAFAQDGVTDDIPDRIVPNCGVTQKDGTFDECGLCDLGQLAQNVINFLVVFAVVTAALLFAWAGVKLLTANGQPGKMTEARNIFTSVIVGLLVIIAAWLIVDVVLKTLLEGGEGETKFGPWNEVCGRDIGI